MLPQSFRDKVRMHSNELPSRLIHSPATPQLIAEPLTLRLAQVSDIVSIIEYYSRNQNYLSRFSALIDPKFLSENAWFKRIEEMQNNFNDDKACNFFMFDSAENVVGVLNFFNIIRGAFHCCTLGYSLDENLQGRGLMTTSLVTVIAYAFYEKNIHRIEANYHPENKKSALVLKRLGFIDEGLAQNYLYINGIWEPHMRTSLTNDNWRSG